MRCLIDPEVISELMEDPGKQYQIVPPYESNHLDTNCWCEPEIIYRDPETDNVLWLHRSLH